jgi:DNA polymerase V
MEKCGHSARRTLRYSPALWALVDCNNFYASCERLFRPDLIGKPVVVLSNNDGCIVARSNEAKALGIAMGEPEFRVRELLKRHNVAVFSSNFALYGDISSRVMRTLESLAPEIEQYSIDEAFIPLAGPLSASADELAMKLRARVRKWTGIVVSVGLGTTRTLAKLASETAKRNDGVCRLDAGMYETERMLDVTGTGEIWGIGRKSAEKLRLVGIHTARQFRDADCEMIKKLLTVAGLKTMMELRGFSCIENEEIPASRRTLISSRSFGRRVTEKEHLAEALAMHAALAGERLRKGKLLAGGLAAHIRTSRYGRGPFYDRAFEVRLRRPTSSTREFIRAAVSRLDDIFRPGYSYAKAGIMLFDLVHENSEPLSLLELATEAALPGRDKKLMKTLDAINRRFGRGTLRFAAEGVPDAGWRMRQTGRSRRWTTNWDDLPFARV